jgi:hypothetical protein
MKKNILFVLMAIVLLADSSFAQQAPKSPKAEAKNDLAKITYSQPSKRGREVFGGLVPYDSVWRTGANNATEITLQRDVKFGGKDVKAGTYTLFTIPSRDKWVVILNSELKQWGSFNYAKIKDKDVVSVEVPVIKLDQEVEMFTIRFDEKFMVMEWEKTQVRVKIK